MNQNASPLILYLGIACIVLGGISFLSINPTLSVGSNSSGNSEIVYNGSETGIVLGNLKKGQSITVSYLSGKIISNTETGWSSPIWGVPQSETSPEWTKGLPYKELNTDALFIDLNGKRIPFQKNQTSITIVANSDGIATLKMNDSRYTGNAGDARFKITILSPQTTFSPRKTVPQGSMLGDAKNGLYYANPTNSLESGVAYKALNGETVYIFDGTKLRGVATSSAYFNFYGCNSNMRIIDCAPVYLMPSSVTKDMLNGEIMK